MKWRTLKNGAGLLLSMALIGASLAGCVNGGGESSGSSAASSAPESSTVTESSASSAAESGAEFTETYDFSAGLDENGCFEGIRALDYVTLPDYKSMEIPSETLEISEDEIKSRENEIFSDYNPSVLIDDRAVEDGDTVNIDYVGSIDGVEFDGGSTGGNGANVTIGVTSYIDDFLEQLIGHKPGETFDVNVTFPENYGKEDLNGKDAVFVTTINYITDQKYKELNNEFVSAELKEEYGWSTVEEMHAGVEEELKQSAAGEYLIQQIQEQAEVGEVPQQLEDYHVGSMKNYYNSLAQQSGLTLKDYLEQIGIGSEDELLKKNEAALETNGKNSLILQALCEDMGIAASEEDVESFLQKEAAVDAAAHSQYKEHYGLPYLKMLARESMVKAKLGTA